MICSDEPVDLQGCTCRCFVSYSGVRLPLNLVTPLDDGQLANRNTFFRAYFDARERLVACEKITYGEVELSHRYRYYESGVLREAVITNADEEVTVVTLDERGGVIESRQVTGEGP